MAEVASAAETPPFGGGGGRKGGACERVEARLQRGTRERRKGRSEASSVVFLSLSFLFFNGKAIFSFVPRFENTVDNSVVEELAACYFLRGRRSCFRVGAF